MKPKRWPYRQKKEASLLPLDPQVLVVIGVAMRDTLSAVQEK